MSQFLVIVDGCVAHSETRMALAHFWAVDNGGGIVCEVLCEVKEKSSGKRVTRKSATSKKAAVK